MTEEKNQIEKTQTKVELQVIPCANQISQERKGVEAMNHENQDDGCVGKLILTVTCDGSKLTKADSGRHNEFQEEVWVTAKVTKANEGKLPDIDVTVRERCGSKLTKADAGIA